MDISKQYIEMCDCPEIRGQRGRSKWRAWDYFQTKDDRWTDTPPEVFVVSGYCTDSGYYGPEAGSEKYPNDEEMPDDAIWLPRQDQLQEMVAPTLPIDGGVLRYANAARGFVYALYQAVEKDAPSYFEQFASMEQLWLAFVMKEKHGKVWNGKWVDRV